MAIGLAIINLHGLGSGVIGGMMIIGSTKEDGFRMIYCSC
jgi:hypothetical protein